MGVAKKLVPCPECRGRGERGNWNPSGTCENCSGTGEVPEPTHRTCGVCNGEGIVGFGAGTMCPRCNGFGGIRIEPDPPRLTCWARLMQEE